MKKYDWSREVTWRENKSSCFPPDVVFPCRVSRHNALSCITSCYSFRYNKQLIAQLVGRHEDLSHPRATWIFRVGQIFVSPSKLGNKCIVSSSMMSPFRAIVLILTIAELLWYCLKSVLHSKKWGLSPCDVHLPADHSIGISFPGTLWNTILWSWRYQWELSYYRWPVNPWELC